MVIESTTVQPCSHFSNLGEVDRILKLKIIHGMRLSQLIHSQTQQLQVMDNFNLRYECNDARDDFSTQLKQGDTSSGIFPNWMSSDVIDDIDELNQNGDDFGDDEDLDDEEYGVNRYSILGP